MVTEEKKARDQSPFGIAYVTHSRPTSTSLACIVHLDCHCDLGSSKPYLGVAMTSRLKRKLNDLGVDTSSSKANENFCLVRYPSRYPQHNMRTNVHRLERRCPHSRNQKTRVNSSLFGSKMLGMRRDAAGCMVPSLVVSLPVTSILWVPKKVCTCCSYRACDGSRPLLRMDAIHVHFISFGSCKAEGGTTRRLHG